MKKIKYRVQNTCVKLEKPRMKKTWDKKEIDLLIEMYPKNTALVIADTLGRSQGSVHNKAFLLGLKKSPDFWKTVLRPPSKTQFKRGHKPWNDGVKGSSGLHHNTRATQFKKGNKPRNTLPNGSLRITKDGYLERKYEKGWIAVHRYVWEAEQGPIPHGYIVVFKHGKKTAIESEVTKDKLECITRAENAKRNSLHRFGPEMAKLYQLKGAIARQINRIARNEMADVG